MFSFFKKNKKDINTANFTNSVEEESNETVKKTNNIYQSNDYMGIKPEYFNQNKIKLNQFLTDDEEYRKKLEHDDNFCSQHGNRKIMSSNSCHRGRYEKDNSALQEIDNVLNAKNDLNSFEYLYKAQKLHKINKKQEVINNIKKQEIIDNNEINRLDKRGLSVDDYNVIVNNMNEQIANISEATRRLLKDEKTKVLHLDTNRLTDDDINPNITTKFYDNRSKKFGLEPIIDVKDYSENLKLDNSISKEELYDHANKLIVENAELLSAQVKHNANITQHNFDTITNTRAFTDNHARLRDVPPVKIEKYVENPDNTINLDALTPYNIVKTDMRIRKSDKRNINLR